MLTSHALATLATDLLYLAPALLLLGWLWFTRRYPGERLLTRLASRRLSQRPRRAPRATPSPRPVTGPLRSGRLIGCWLAVRPPPPLVVAS